MQYGVSWINYSNCHLYDMFMSRSIEYMSKKNFENAGLILNDVESNPSKAIMECEALWPLCGL